MYVFLKKRYSYLEKYVCFHQEHMWPVSSVIWVVQKQWRNLFTVEFWQYGFQGIVKNSRFICNLVSSKIMKIHVQKCGKCIHAGLFTTDGIYFWLHGHSSLLVVRTVRIQLVMFPLCSACGAYHTISNHGVGSIRAAVSAQRWRQGGLGLRVILCNTQECSEVPKFCALYTIRCSWRFRLFIPTVLVSLRFYCSDMLHDFFTFYCSHGAHGTLVFEPYCQLWACDRAVSATLRDGKCAKSVLT